MNSQTWRAWRAEVGPLWRLAWPVVTAEVGWMSMGIVDTILVGRVSAAAIGAVGIGSTVFFTVALFGIGLLLGLDYKVAHAIGSAKPDEARAWLAQGVYLALGVALPGIALLWYGTPHLAALGVRAEVMGDLIPYGRALSWSLLPLLLMTAMRRYLQAIGRVQPVMFAIVSANIINAIGAWALIFGHLGLPRLGAEGAGWATCISRIYMALVMLVALRQVQPSFAAIFARPDAARIRALLRLGLPAALQTTFECGVFAAASTLAGRLSPEALAAHHIVLNAASMTFMVPLGISSAGAVRVGHSLGEGRPEAARLAGWLALALGGLFMTLAGLTFLAIPEWIARVFTTTGEVIATCVALLQVAALFQLFDGIQVVATGVLRGTGETRVPMFANLVGHWLLGLPIGYGLCFGMAWGVQGLWAGLCVGLVTVAVILLLMWSRRIARLQAA